MHIVLVDAKNFAFRMHYSHMALSTGVGEPTSLLYGGLDGLLTLARRVPGAPIVFVWDGGGETWRHRYSKGTYKANRAPNPDTATVFSQLPVFRRLLEDIGVRNFEVPGLEGDDLVGIVASAVQKMREVDKVIICSTDKDYYQLLDSRLVMLGKFEAGRTTKFLGPDHVKAEYGVECRDWTKFRALTGDKGDNIIQARKGIGPKTALRLLLGGVDPSRREFGAQSREGQRLCAGMLKDVWPQVYRNYVLSRIVVDPGDVRLSEDVRQAVEALPVWASEVDCLRADADKRTDGNYSKVARFLARMEMTELLGRRRELFQLP